MIALAGQAHAAAAAAIWPHLLRPLAGAGAAARLQHLAHIAAAADPPGAALDYAAQAIRP
ncbi:hypothetical protein ACFQ77_41075 [Streptomyces virginiae]|uniref:hypothetical protein n=1 Tax=Streptomyces virginiae TaxID=1961 RepID=UPI0036CD15EE